mmetsp:Transcript_17504/g.26361  ORF Transcript_17504/g.26361 Transcript_17504/m.26361 type:complete len:262 (-) Transcript_17504:15-800(-)
MFVQSGSNSVNGTSDQGFAPPKKCSTFALSSPEALPLRRHMNSGKLYELSRCCGPSSLRITGHTAPSRSCSGAWKLTADELPFTAIALMSDANVWADGRMCIQFAPPRIDLMCLQKRSPSGPPACHAAASKMASVFLTNSWSLSRSTTLFAFIEKASSLDTTYLARSARVACCCAFVGVKGSSNTGARTASHRKPERLAAAAAAQNLSSRERGELGRGWLPAVGRRIASGLEMRTSAILCTIVSSASIGGVKFASGGAPIS